MGTDQGSALYLSAETGVAHSCGGWLEGGCGAYGCEVDLKGDVSWVEVGSEGEWRWAGLGWC